MHVRDAQKLIGGEGLLWTRNTSMGRVADGIVVSSVEAYTDGRVRLTTTSGDVLEVYARDLHFQGRHGRAES